MVQRERVKFPVRANYFVGHCHKHPQMPPLEEISLWELRPLRGAEVGLGSQSVSTWAFKWRLRRHRAMVSHSRTPGFVSSAGSRLAGGTRMSAELNSILPGSTQLNKPASEGSPRDSEAKPKVKGELSWNGLWPHTFLVFRALVLLFRFLFG